MPPLTLPTINLNTIDFNLIEHVGMAVFSDIEAFVAGQAVTSPPVDAGNIEITLTVKRVNAAEPVGNVVQILSSAFSAYMAAEAGYPASLPAVTQKVNNTYLELTVSLAPKSAAAAPVAVAEGGAPAGSIAAASAAANAELAPETDTTTKAS